MGIRIPKNQTVESKYTSGKEYMFASTQNEYKGYYYEMNGKIFAGEKFKPGDPEIIKIKSDKYNMLLGNAATYLYGLVSKVKLPNSKAVPFFFQPSTEDAKNGEAIRYYSQQSNTKIIKEINENNYKELLKNPLFIVVQIKCFIIQDLLDPVGNNNYVFDNDSLNKAEQQMPGIKAFLGL